MNARRVFDEVDLFLRAYPSFRPRTDNFAYSPQGPVELMICLSGVLPAVLVPVDIWLPRDVFYAATRLPFVFVNPRLPGAGDFQLRPTSVSDARGVVQLLGAPAPVLQPYLVALGQWLQDRFQERPAAAVPAAASAVPIVPRPVTARDRLKLRIQEEGVARAEASQADTEQVLQVAVALQDAAGVAVRERQALRSELALLEREARRVEELREQLDALLAKSGSDQPKAADLLFAVEDARLLDLVAAEAAQTDALELLSRRFLSGSSSGGGGGGGGGSIGEGLRAIRDVARQQFTLRAAINAAVVK